MKRFRLHVFGGSLLLSGLALAAAPELRDLAPPTAKSAAERQLHLVTLQKDQTAAEVLEQIRRIDPTVKTVYQSRLRPDYLWLEFASGALPQLPKAIRAEAEPASPLPRQGAQKSRARPTRQDAGTAFKTATPPPVLTNDVNAGAGVRVAIISTGVDYTHQALGGVGTRAQYDKAMLNGRAIWSGFPTDVVVDGVDFCSQNGCSTEWKYFDPNPIEPDDADFDQLTGRGTHLASVVHALAPGAKLVAYKVSHPVAVPDYGTVLEYANFQHMAQLFDRLVDPNLDGDHSDRIPIALLDMMGAFAYNAANDVSPSRDQIILNLIEAAAAHGVLVITTAGDWPFNSKYSISQAGAAPSALTVAGVDRDAQQQLRASSYSGNGPVRGTAVYSKPDLASYSNDIVGASVGTGDQQVARTHVGLAAARLAAAAAILKAARPQLSATELKATLVNTATHDIRSVVDDELADLTEVGNGREQLNAALSASVLAWVGPERQPLLNFGFQEVESEIRLVRELTLRNLGDRDVSYSVSHRWLAEKAGNAAASLAYPQQITVPARRSITVPVVLHIDASKLPLWPITDSTRFGIAAFRALDLNGQLQLVTEQGPTLQIGMRVLPRVRSRLERKYETITEDNATPFALQHATTGVGLSMDIRNNGLAPLQLAAYPLLAKVDALPLSYEGRKGDLFRYLAGGISVDERCDSGHKLSMAVSYWEPTEIALAAKFDKIGAPVFYWEIYPQRIVEAYGLHIKMRYQPQLADNDYVGYGWVEIDNNGQPQGRYIDLNMTYNPYEPLARVKTSKLPVLFAGNTRNIVQQLCLEELFHHELDTLADFDENLGFLFASNRDAHPKLNEPIIFHNPVGNAYGELNDWGELVKIGAAVTFTEPGGSTSAGPASPLRTLQPGESARLHAVKDGKCDFFLGNRPDICWRDNNRFLLMSLTDDWVFESPVAYGDSYVVPTVRAGQHFVVPENAVAGDVVGKIELAAQSLFAMAGRFQLLLWAELPGTPFALAPNGELRVVNPDALDYEHATQLTLQIAGRNPESTIWSPPVAVTVSIENANDNAPLSVREVALPDTELYQPFRYELAGHFADADGDALIFAAVDLPSGLELDSHGVLSGQPKQAGSHVFTLQVRDGEHQTELELTLTVTGDDHDGGGGASVFGGLLLLCSLIGFRLGAARRRDGARSGGRE